MLNVLCPCTDRGQVFRNQTRLYPTHACKEYNEQFPALFQACGYR